MTGQLNVPAEAVEAAQSSLGCKSYDGVWNCLTAPICDRHGEEMWTDAGCPVAVSVAAAVVAALDLPARDRETAVKALHEAAADAERNGDYRTWTGNVADWLRRRAEIAEAVAELADASALREGRES